MTRPRILFLGPPDSAVLDWLRASGELVAATADPIDDPDADILVSHGYRHILRRPVLSRVPAVNLHIALLPWNRGADPNLWSWIESTPKGVTIHWIDEGIDTGDIIAQREVAFDAGETLGSSYTVLQREMLALFIETWPSIRDGTAARRPQESGGSLHRIADRARVEHLLTAGWETPVADFRPARPART